MSVVAAYLYRNGRRAAPVSIDAPPVLAEDKSEFIWIGLFEPSEGELRTLQQRFDLHPLAVEDALKAHQLPKIEVYGDQLFAVARTAYLAGEERRIAYGETAIFIGQNHLITCATDRHVRTRSCAASWKLPRRS